jgi:spore germination cell wall hydrolase CwlJ-like protein
MFKTTIKMLIVLMLSTSIMLMAYNQFMQIQIVHQAKEVVTQQLVCLAKNIYYESATESYEGKLAVAQVTMNRLNHPDYPSDVCGVVYQKTGSTCQFSWVCEKVERNERDKYIWEECMQIAKRALTEDQVHAELADRNALYYHAVYVNPKWKNTKVVKKIGNHIFYVRT